MNKTRGQSVLKILNGGVKSLNYPTPGVEISNKLGGWRCELGGSTPNPPSNLTLPIAQVLESPNQCLALLCTFSNFLMSGFRYGFQLWHNYSDMYRTSILYPCFW